MSTRDLVIALLVGLVVWAAVASLATWSIDFGRHWDEKGAVDALQRSATKKNPLPYKYFYPSLMHDIALLQVAVDGARYPITSPSTWTPAYREAVLLRARTVSAWITLLAVVGVAVLSAYLAGSWLPALPSSLMLAGSFEYFYHARWLAPDGLLATAGIFTLGALVVARRRRSVRWLVAATALAGVACAAKYPGGILLLPVLLVLPGVMPAGDRRRQALRLLAVFAGVFVLITPGSILQMKWFIRHVTDEMRHYATGHGAYTTTSVVDHVKQLSWYLMAVFPSSLRWGSLGVSAIAIWGCVALWRRERGAFLILVVTMLAYFAYFATQKVMIVRNSLLLMPILAVCFAFGLHAIHEGRGRVLRIAALVMVFAFAIQNAYGLWAGSRTVVDRRWSDPVGEFSAWTKDHTDVRLAATAAVHRALGAQAAALGVVTEPPFDFAVAFQREPPTKTTVNLDGYFLFASGPQEVNLDYYSSWESTDRVVVLDPAKGGERWPEGWLVLDR